MPAIAPGLRCFNFLGAELNAASSAGSTHPPRTGFGAVRDAMYGLTLYVVPMEYWVCHWKVGPPWLASRACNFDLKGNRVIRTNTGCPHVEDLDEFLVAGRVGVDIFSKRVPAYDEHLRADCVARVASDIFVGVCGGQVDAGPSIER
jgi:hypothetical protein